jgi:hypothetical protein
MPTSTVHVQYRDGKPACSVRVVLGFREGMTGEAYTDGSGDAIVDHYSCGQAEVYISGTKYHSFHAPGRTAVTIN